jgi:phage terminase small subunit
MGHPVAGRPPKPTALKLLQGKPGHRALPKGEPKPPPGKVECPEWLGVEERKFWAELAPIYQAMGCLTVADVTAFATWMCELAKVKWCQVNKEPVPASVSRAVQNWAMQFGGTPASRAKVAVKPEEKKDEFGELYG